LSVRRRAANSNMSNLKDPVTPHAWYRQPIVWMLIAFPSIAVIGGITTLVLAIRSDDGLVADDYYRRGKEINLVLARDDAARRYGLTAEVTFAPDLSTIQTALTGSATFIAPASVQVSFLNATRAGLDRVVTVNRAPQGRYASPLPPLAPGHWYVQLEADDWRLLGDLHLPGERQLRVVPPPR